MKSLPKCVYLQQDFIKGNYEIQKRWLEDTVKVNKCQTKTLAS